MGDEKSELHGLFEKLDAVSQMDFRPGCWTLERSPAGWTVLTGRQEVKGETPEEAVRLALTKTLRDAEERVRGKEDSAKDARDYVAQLRKLVGE